MQSGNHTQHNLVDENPLQLKNGGPFVDHQNSIRDVRLTLPLLSTSYKQDKGHEILLECNVLAEKRKPQNCRVAAAAAPS
jgi:hypothetical protein